MLITEGIPFLVLGPFGQLTDTERERGWEVVPEYKGLETPYLGEFEGVVEELPALNGGFTPDTSGRYEVKCDQPGVWQRVVVEEDALSFFGVCGSPQPWWMIAYAYTEVHSPEARTAVLSLGSDHAVAVWLNDEPVLQHGGHGAHRGGQRPGKPGQNTADLALKEGWNRLWIKAVQRGKARLYINFLAKDGTEMTDLHFRVPEVTAQMVEAPPKWSRPLSDDLKLVRDRLLAPMLTAGVDDQAIREILTLQSSEGDWSDIDYTDVNPARWDVSRHIGRLSQLAVAYAAPGSPFKGSPEVRAAVLAGLDHWLEKDYENPNNWYPNQITVPRAMADVFLLMEDQLDAGQKNRIVEILKRAPIKMTGQNLIWLSEVNIKRGVIDRDADRVNLAMRFILQEIRMSEGEGLQHDMSFHQHGGVVYNHSYGFHFAVDCTRLASVFAGTKFAFPEEKINLLAAYVLDGSQWMTRNDTCDPGPRGRAIAWPDRNADADYLAVAARNLLKVKTGREADLRALIARVEGDADAPPLVGNRCFWESDYMVHQRPGYYTSARAHSTRTHSTDYPANSDGLLNHYLGDGCNYLIRDGDEYRNIFPVWDWRKVPGTTVEQSPEYPGDAGPVQRVGETEFVGGVSDGSVGILACDFKRETLRARKAWVFFDEEYVCLGAGIACDSENPVATTVDQRHLEGEVAMGAGDVIGFLPQGTHRLEPPFWAYHDGVGIFFLEGGEVVLKNDAQGGNWHRINSSLSDETVTHDVFMPWINHGVRPEGAEYAYIVAPGMSKEKLDDYSRQCPVSILSNTPAIQAVHHETSDVTAAAFYEAGELELPSGGLIGANEPCVLMLRSTQEGVQLAVSDPTQKLSLLTVAIGGKLSGEGCTWNPQTGRTEILIELPADGFAGRSVVRELREDP